MPLKQKSRLPQVLLILLSIAAALILLYRVPFGIDVTDTSFWTAEPYLITQGAVPFVDNWSQTPLSSLLIAPFVRLFTTVTGGTEGIMLFMFYAAFLFRLAVPLLTWLLLRRRMDSFWAGVFCLLFFVFDYGYNRDLNYNFMSLALLLLGGALLWDALGQEEPRAAAIRYAWAGLVMALCALAHIIQLVSCLLFAAFLLVLERRRWGRLSCRSFYILAGLSAAALTVIGLELAGGGGLFSGLFLDLAQNNYFRIAHMAPAEQLQRVLYCCAELFRFVRLPFAVSLALYLAAFHRQGGQVVLPGLMAALAGGCSFVCLRYARSYLWALRNGENPFLGAQPLVLCLFLAAPVWFLLMSRQDRRRFLPGFLFFWLPGLVSIALEAAASHATADYRFTLLTGGALLSLPLAAAAFQSRASGDRLSAGVHKALLLFLAASFAVYSLSVQYACVYRDEALPALICRVERGVYRGLYTTPERAEALQDLEEQLHVRVSPGEAVLFADLMPMAYLMTDGLPCTPSVWDPCHYRYGFQDDTLYQSYFEKSGRVPDKIFFIRSEEHPLSIDDPENEFAAWVRSHYTLAETVGEGPFSFRLFTRNP